MARSVQSSLRVGADAHSGRDAAADHPESDNDPSTTTPAQPAPVTPSTTTGSKTS
jgi:hypothetical protein